MLFVSSFSSANARFTAPLTLFLCTSGYNAVSRATREISEQTLGPSPTFGGYEGKISLHATLGPLSPAHAIGPRWPGWSDLVASVPWSRSRFS
jgi:hypothetical protein